MKLRWNKCPFSVKGKYNRTKEGNLPTIQIEALEDHDFYVWNWLAGKCGTNNYKTIFAMLQLFRDIISSTYNFNQSSPYTRRTSSTTRRVPYFLGDGNYPNWPYNIPRVRLRSRPPHVYFTAPECTCFIWINYVAVARAIFVSATLIFPVDILTAPIPRPLPPLPSGQPPNPP